MSFSIGTTHFLDLSPPPAAPARVVRPITFEGEDGVAYELLGRRADVTQHESFAVVDDLEDAKALGITYANLVGTQQTVVIAGQSYPTMLVVNLTGFRWEAVVRIVGDGVKANGAAFTDLSPAVHVFATWHLQYAGVE
jgi:hypothetical protein